MSGVNTRTRGAGQAGATLDTAGCLGSDPHGLRAHPTSPSDQTLAGNGEENEMGISTLNSKVKRDIDESGPIDQQ